MNKAMPQPVDSGINVTGVVGALGATSLPSIGHDTRSLHVGQSFGHFMCSGSVLHLPQGQGRQCPAVDPEHKTVKTRSAPVLSFLSSRKKNKQKVHFAAQDAIDVAAAQNALDDHNGVGKDSQLHRLGGSVGLRETQMLKASDSLLQMSCPTASQCHPWPPELTRRNKGRLY